MFSAKGFLVSIGHYKYKFTKKILQTNCNDHKIKRKKKNLFRCVMYLKYRIQYTCCNWFFFIIAIKQNVKCLFSANKTKKYNYPPSFANFIFSIHMSCLFCYTYFALFTWFDLQFWVLFHRQVDSQLLAPVMPDAVLLLGRWTLVPQSKCVLQSNHKNITAVRNKLKCKSLLEHYQTVLMYHQA